MNFYFNIHDSSSKLYTEKTVINRFVWKYGASNQDQIIKNARALQTDFVQDQSLQGYHRKSKIKEEFFFKNKIDLNEEGLKAKVLALAMRIEKKLFSGTFGRFLDDVSIRSDGEQKDAPHIRLGYLEAMPYFSNKYNKRIHLIFTEKIGEGAFNTAYHVINTTGNHNRHFIFRDFQIDDKTTDQNVINWRSEISLHELFCQYVPNIVLLHDKIIIDTRNSLVEIKVRRMGLILEQCQGNLSFLYKIDLTKAQQKSIIKQILAALRVLHSCRYMHGDIKPENILFYQEGEDYKIRITDFANSIYSENNFNFFGTTPEYLPPEGFYIKSSKKTHEEEMGVDNFAVGKIAYELKHGLLSSSEISNRMMLLRTALCQNELEAFTKTLPEIEQNCIIKCKKTHNLTNEQFYNIIVYFYIVRYEIEQTNQWIEDLKSDKNSYDEVIASLLNLELSQRMKADEAYNRL